MTRFGKVLVYINLTLSLIFAVWALGVYTQRVDWTDKKKEATDERSWGRIAKSKDEIDRWTGPGSKGGPRPVAEGRWQAALVDVRAVEGLREATKAWHADQLAALESKGKDAAPIKRVAYVKGEMQVKDARPVLEVVNDKAGQPLKPREGLKQDQAKLNADLAEIQKTIRDLTAQSTKLTEEMVVLFREIERAAQAREGAGAEQRYLEQILYNVQAESELLFDRQRALEARLQELKVRASSQNPQ